MEIIRVKAKDRYDARDWYDSILNPRCICVMTFRPDMGLIRVNMIDGCSRYVSIHDLDKLETALEHQNDTTITEVVVKQEGGM